MNVYAAPEAEAKALEVAGGNTFQRGLILGYERLSLATLRGKALNWKSSYVKSRDNLFRKLWQAGVSVSEAVGPKGHRMLLLGVDPESPMPEGYKWKDWL